MTPWAAHQHLLTAIANDDAAAVLSTLSDWNDPSSTPLHAAAVYGATQVMKALVERHSQQDEDSNTTHLGVHALDDGSFTPLHLAAAAGYLDVVRLLLAHGANPNFPTPHALSLSLSPQIAVDLSIPAGRTPLHMAAERCHLEVVQCLLQEGHADPTLLDDQRRTPRDVCLQERAKFRQPPSERCRACAQSLRPDHQATLATHSSCENWPHEKQERNP